MKSPFRPSARFRRYRTALGILVLFLFAAFLAEPRLWNGPADAAGLPHFWNVPFKLGLDLQGGTHLVYEADVSNIPDPERADALEGVRDVIERRVNAFGVSEPVVQTNRSGGTWRIIVELAGIRDVKEAIRLIGETPILEFKEEKEVQPVELTPEQEQELKDKNAAVGGEARAALAAVREQGKEADLLAIAEKHRSENPESRIEAASLGFVREEGPHAELWKWASRQAIPSVSTALVELPEGPAILKVKAADDQPEIMASHLLICFDGAVGCVDGPSKEDALADIEGLKALATAENFEEQVKLHSSEPNAANTGGDLGWFSRGMMVAPFEEAAFAAKKGEIVGPVETDFGYHLIYKKDERAYKEYDIDRILFRSWTPEEIAPPEEPWENTDLSGKHLKRSQVQFEPTTNEPNVSLLFNEEGDKLFEEITERNIGKLVAIFLDGEPISIPRVQQKITGGNAVITGGFTVQEAKLLAQRLNAGALPVPISLLSQQTVGASLGQDSLQKSLLAGLIGFLIVALFMILYYRLPGLLATLALVMYAAFVLAAFKLLGVTLTLSGIAGFILSVGMAVDANILIFERLKEELRNGRPLDSSVNEGFSRAWTSIRDSNVSSLITAGILYTFTSSSVRGFALTLAIGIVISMFSAITVTRTLLRLVGPWTKERLWLYNK